MLLNYDGKDEAIMSMLLEGVSMKQISRDLSCGFKRVARIRDALAADLAVLPHSEVCRKESAEPVAACSKGASQSSVPKGMGMSLTNTRVLKQKPQSRTKGLIFGLPKNMGYTPEELSEQWGVSEENITTHARRYKCLGYTESKTNPGVFVQVVMHPDTAEKLGGESW